MKERNELARAITELPDDLLLEGEQTMKPGRIIKFRRLIAAAAVIALLAVTVGAVKYGIEYRHGRENVGETPHYTIEFAYPLAPVTIRQEAYEELTEALNVHWNANTEQREQMTDRHFLGFAGLAEERIRTIEELEAYLGIELITSPMIDESALRKREENEALRNGLPSAMLIMPCADVGRDAMKEYEDTGEVSLQGIVIWVYLSDDGTNAYAGLRMIIPLTQKFADTYPEEIWYSDPEIGDYEVEQLQTAGREVVICSQPALELERRPAALALYSEGGIGYYVYATAEPLGWHDDRAQCFTHGRERLMRLIENLE